MNKAELQTHYEAQKALLNDNQRIVVETIEGPVMVLAGPGTGKTQVLAFRIAEILQKTDSSPRNILALTFTESGVVAMRERLASLIGVAAYGVGIYTFHSFANRVINDAGAEFYKNHSLDPIDDIAQLKLIIELTDELNNELIRPLRSPYFYVKPIIHAIKNLKNEGVEPGTLSDLCRNAIEELQTSESSISKSGKNKGEIKQSVKDKIKSFERSIAVARIYERYEEELTKRGLYDYEDMILFVIKSFKTSPDLKAQYQEQFHYILVDEYQDTNSAQNTLVHLLSDYFDNPNVFVVGDDKQSIYRFQGASVANLMTFLEWYPQATLISLKNNYRSGQAILNNAYALIQNNTEQLATILPQLETELLGQDTGGTVCFSQYATFDKETLGVVTHIKNLLSQGCKASSIAILYRENSEAQDFAHLLTRQGIAYHLEAGSDVLIDPDVRHLINLLELASNPLNEWALFRYLHAPFSGITTTDLVTLSRLRKENRTTWRELVTGELADTLSALSSWEAVKSAYQNAQEWHRYAINHNLGDTIEHIFLNSGLLNHIMQQGDQLERLHRVRCFFDEVKSLMNTVQYATLDDLFERIMIRQTYNVPLVSSPLADQSDDAVRLMTAHKSKGLEFDYVFIVHLYDGRWGNNAKRDLVAFPEGIIPHHKKTQEDTGTEEERRLFYVALTRAKKGIYLSCSQLDSGQKKLLSCQFLSELESVAIIEPKDTAYLSIQAFFSPVATHFVDQKSRNYLKEIVTKQTITPTGLNTYLTCPMEYLYKEIYCIPGVREPFQSFGTAIHKAFEMWGNWSKTDGYPFGLNSILSVFCEVLTKEGLTENEVERYAKLGREVLGAYWEQYSASWVVPLATEYSFTPHNVCLDGAIPITGKIDKIEPIKGSKSVRVIDFKTGRVRSRGEIEGNTEGGDGDYKRQLVFYTVLAEADPFFPYTVGEASLAFIDDQKKFTVEMFEITQSEKDDLKALIRSVHQEITQLHFDHTPHKKHFNAGESLCDLLRVEPSVLMPSTAAPP
jgi:DNA helicase II / ATP-dependent DNA helicase PcrA